MGRQPFLKYRTRIFSLLTLILAAFLACACQAGLSNRITPQPTQTHELILYDWEDYIPPSIIDDFQREYGVRIIYQTYNSDEEAVENIRSGKEVFDIAVVENDNLQDLIASGKIATIDHHDVPNLENISPNFRNLIFDPSNQYSVPNNWGTTGLLVRTDLTAKPVTRWADLWDEDNAGKILVRQQPTELISIALKSLGYHLNSENPKELEEALHQLVELAPRIRYVDVDPEAAVAPLLDGQAVMMVGWTGDAEYARSKDPRIHYILPEEGTLLWGDSYVISSTSTKKSAAEQFINYLLQPEVSAQIIQKYLYPSANEAARGHLDPQLANDPILYPSSFDFRKGEWYLPLSQAGQKLYDDIWQQFLSHP